MRKFLVLAFTLLGQVAAAQIKPPVAYQPQMISFHGAPTGTCEIYQQALNDTNGQLSSCNPVTKTWTVVSLGGGVTPVNGNYTVLSSDNGKEIVLTGGPGTITFPSPTAPGFGSGTSFLIQNSSSNSFTLTGSFGTFNLGPSGGYLIVSDGSSYKFMTFNASIGASNVQAVNYVPLATDNGSFLEFNGSNLTLTLTNPIIGGGGQVYFVQNLNSTPLTISPNGLTIDGSSANLTLKSNQGIIITSDINNHYYTMRGTSGDAIQVSANIVSSLPSCGASSEGLMRAVTDSNTNTWGATIAAGGANHVLGYCDGTNWTVAGK